MSPRSLVKPLFSIFSPGVAADNVLFVNLMTKSSALDRLFKFQRLDSVQYRLSLPNPDDISEELEIYRGMSERNIRFEERVYKALPNKSVLLDRDDEKNLRVASLGNGFFKSTGSNEEGKKETLSSAAQPDVEEITITARGGAVDALLQRLFGKS